MRLLGCFLLITAVCAGQNSSKITIYPKQDGSSTGVLDFRALTGPNYVGWKAPNKINSPFRLTLPTVAPPANNSRMSFNTNLTSGWSTELEYAFTDTNWTQSITSDLSVAGTHTITLTPGPIGVSAAITDSQYRITGGPGAAELVTPTGVGTCNGTGQESCTIQVITANSHATSPTISSSTAGLQEAWNAGRTNLTCPDGTYTFYGTAKTGDRSVALRGTWNCIIAPGASNMTVIHVNTVYMAKITGIAFNHYSAATDVTYIKLGTGSISNGYSILDNINISAGAGGYGVDGRRAHSLNVINGNFYQQTSSGGGTAILTGNVIHGDFFGGYFVNNVVIGDWNYGIEDRGSPINATKNIFNGPRNHIGFLNWISVVNVNGTAVTWVSGETFDTTWTGFVEIDGQVGNISSVTATTITLSNSLGVITNGQLRHTSTGQIQIEGNNFDSGLAWYQGGFIAAASLNSFYSIRVDNNFCSAWNSTTFTNCIYFALPNATGITITGNSIQNGSGTGTHYGINLTNVGDATVVGNSLRNYTSSGIFADIQAANTPAIVISGNFVNCNLAAASTYGIVAKAGRFNISGNSVENCDIGVLTGGTAIGPINGTQFLGTVATKYQFDSPSTMTLTDTSGIAFADLPANSTNGTLLYCTNCTAGSSPCSGAGTGAYAKRLNGAWQCN